MRPLGDEGAVLFPAAAAVAVVLGPLVLSVLSRPPLPLRDGDLLEEGSGEEQEEVVEEEEEPKRIRGGSRNVDRSR